MTSRNRLTAEPLGARRIRLSSENMYMASSDKLGRYRLNSDGGRPAFSELSNYNKVRTAEYYDPKTGKTRLVTETKSASHGINYQRTADPELFSSTRIEDANITKMANDFLHRNENPTRKSKQDYDIEAIARKMMPIYPDWVSQSYRDKALIKKINDLKTGKCKPPTEFFDPNIHTTEYFKKEFDRMEKEIEIEIENMKRKEAMEKKQYPQTKATLCKKAKVVKKYNDDSTYTVDIFNKEYLNEIIRNAFETEEKLLLKSNFYIKYNPNLELRMGILSWLIKIQDKIDIRGGMYFITVNLFDLCLSTRKIPTQTYKLFMITIIWLVNKCHGTKILTATKLLQLCNNCYYKDELLTLEYKLLKHLGYSINYIDPTIFAHYYLYQLNVSGRNVITYITYYIMEGFTFYKHYSVYRPSMIAATAIYLCISRVCPQYLNNMKILRNFYSLREVAEMATTMAQHMKTIPSHQFANVLFFKYNTEEAKYASQVFTKSLSS